MTIGEHAPVLHEFDVMTANGSTQVIMARPGTRSAAALSWSGEWFADASGHVVEIR